MNKTYLLAGLLILALGIYLLFVYDRGQSSLNPDDIAFAVEDTAAIQTITLTKVIEGKDIERLVLDRLEDGTWQLDKKYPVFQPRIDYLLKTMHLIHIQEKLVEEGITSGEKILDLTHIRVEIYSAEKRIKGYLLGTSAKGNRGSLMKMMGGRYPYIVELPGLQGYINSHYTMDRKIWRENLLFDGRLDRILGISMNFADAEKSFRLVREDTASDWRLAGEESPLNQANLEKYLAKFDRKIYAESFVQEEYPGKLEDLRNQTPTITFSVNYTSGNTRTCYLFEREENPNNYFGWVEGEDELLTVQHFVFDKFLEERAHLLELEL